MQDSKYWLDKISSLKVDRTHGDPAPHKPLLLLVILDLAEEGKLPQILEKNQELEYRFQTYSQIVSPRRTITPRLVYPLFYLKSQEFWTPLDNSGFPVDDYKTMAKVGINPSLYSHLQNLSFRVKAREILVSSYFYESEYPSLMGLMNESYLKSISLNYEKSDDIERYKVAREAQFKIQVLSAYAFICALTGRTGNIVATHIQPFEDKRYYEVQNGIALCGKAKELFSKGEWSLSDDYKVITGSTDSELSKYENYVINIPHELKYAPNK